MQGKVLSAEKGKYQVQEEILGAGKGTRCMPTYGVWGMHRLTGCKER